MTDPRIGQQGSAVITWQNGRQSVVRGEILIINVHANEVYLSSSLGNVVGDLDTLEFESDYAEEE